MGALGLQLHRPLVRLEIAAKAFSTFTDEEIEHLLACTSATTKSFKRGEVLVSQADPSSTLGIVVKGTLLLSEEDFGHDSPLAFLNPGDHFGEDLGWSDSPTSRYTVTAASAGTVVLLDLTTLQNLDGHLCKLRTRLSAKLLEFSAENTARATAYQQMRQQDTLRQRLAQFFLNQRSEQGTDKLLITLNREQFAAYVGTDKAMLAKELKAMQNEELIEFYRSSFRILKDLSQEQQS